MSKLKSKSDVIEWYWPDFLGYCMRYNKNRYGEQYRVEASIMPTVDQFWLWYITIGPAGTKDRNLYYTKEDVEYV